MKNAFCVLAQTTMNTGSLKSLLVSFGPFILIIIVMYFLLFRSQQKRNKERQQMLDSVRSGDKVVTNGGMIGIISSIKEKTVILKVAENVKIEVIRSSLSAVLEKGTE